MNIYRLIVVGLISIHATTMFAEGEFEVSITVDGEKGDTATSSSEPLTEIACEIEGGCEPFTYEWTFGGDATPAQASSEDPGPVTFSEEGTIELTVTDADGAEATDQIKVYLPELEFRKSLEELENKLSYVPNEGEWNKPPEECQVEIKEGGDLEYDLTCEGSVEETEISEVKSKFKTTDSSANVGDIKIKLKFQGRDLETVELTAITPTAYVHTTYADVDLNHPLQHGWQTSSSGHVNDNFGDRCKDLAIDEEFGSHIDHQPNDWSSLGAYTASGYTDASSGVLVDTYSVTCGILFTLNPVPLGPGYTNAYMMVYQKSQKYWAGDAEHGGTPKGVMVTDHFLNMMEGLARLQY